MHLKVVKYIRESSYPCLDKFEILYTLSPSLYLGIYCSEILKILQDIVPTNFLCTQVRGNKESTVRDLAQHSESQYPICYRAEANSLKKNILADKVAYRVLRTEEHRFCM
jgi:hypothetical protein